jgi:hypothetical protein
MGGTLRILEFWIRSYLLNAKVHFKSAINFVQWWNLLKKTEQNSDFPLFPILDPKVRLRFEILFKKTHPRTNLTTLYLTKMYLLNTIKPFWSHENGSLTKSQNPLQREYPYKPEFQSSEYIVLFLDTKLLNKKAVRFVLWWNSLKQIFHFPILSLNLYGRYP